MFKKVIALIVVSLFLLGCAFSAHAEAAAAKKKTTSKKPGVTCAIKLGKIGNIKIKL